MNTTQASPHGTNRMTAAIVGVLFLTAIMASLVGGSLVDALASAPDTLRAVTEFKTPVLIGVLLELLNGICVLGIGVLMFPILRQHNEKMALGYLGFRLVEAVFCSLSVVSPLALLSLGQQAVAADSFQALGALALAERASVTGLLVPVFFSLGALLFYTALYQSQLLPRFISVWGLIAVALILTVNLLSRRLEIDMSIGLLFALPIILNEMFLGIWLLVKGFNPGKTA